jgi:hypothetical protein
MHLAGTGSPMPSPARRQGLRALSPSGTSTHLKEPLMKAAFASLMVAKSLLRVFQNCARLTCFQRYLRFGLSGRRS